jgi:hypothetical protein
MDRVPGVEEVNASADAPGLDDSEAETGVRLPVL